MAWPFYHHFRILSVDLRAWSLTNGHSTVAQRERENDAPDQENCPSHLSVHFDDFCLFRCRSTVSVDIRYEAITVHMKLIR